MKCRIIILVLLVFVGVKTATAQVKIHYNLPHYDEKTLHYGFFLAMNYSNFRVTHSERFVQGTDSIQWLRGWGANAFALGFILNYRLGEYFDARIHPSVAFYSRYISFKYLFDEDDEINEFESVDSYIELPLLLKYKSYRRKNSRVYMIGGLKPGIQVGKKKKNTAILPLKSLDFSLEYGFGIDIYYPLFKFSPELRFSLGLVNLLGESDEVVPLNTDRISTYSVTALILFE